MLSAMTSFMRKMLSSFIYIVKSMTSPVRSFLFVLYYPKLHDMFYNRKVESFKKEILTDIDTLIPSETNKLKILEIGVGPGSNLDYLPKKCRYFALDKNAYFEKNLLEKLQRYPGIILEKFINECGENMKSVPSNSMDVVLSSSIHCSVDNSKDVLKEINRVLVPGGRYYFFEHVLDEPNTFRYKLQDFMNKTGLWQLTFHGCTFIDFEEIISRTDFIMHKTKRYTFDIDSWKQYSAYLVACHIGGYALKQTSDSIQSASYY